MNPLQQEVKTVVLDPAEAVANELCETSDGVFLASIKQALADNTLTIDELTAAFKAGLEKALK